MPLKGKAWPIATMAGLAVIMAVHTIWLTGLYSADNERPLRLIGAIVALATGTSYLRLWAHRDTELKDRRRFYEGLGLLGAAVIALNLVFVHDDLWSKLLAAIGLIALLAGVSGASSKSRPT